MTLLDSTSTFIFLGLIAYLFWFQSCRGVYTKTDRQYKIIIIFYFLSVAISGINWILFQLYQDFYDSFHVERIVEFVDLLTAELAVLNLVVIVFEMHSLKIMLTAASKKENERKQKINTIVKYFVLVTSFIAIVSSLVLMFKSYN